jgi:hypothetical protein
MADRYRIENIGAALEARAFPTVTTWNRLEGRPRTADFVRSLRAEVRDPLWMLARQWQLAEFVADDAGSPVETKVHVESRRLTRYRPGDTPATDFDEAVPLEATVERRPLQLGLDLRLAMGRRWLAMVAPIHDYRDAFVARYAIQLPDPDDPADAAICAHPAAWAAASAVAGRAMDGGLLYEHLAADPANHPYDLMPTVLDEHKQPLDDAAVRFAAWFRQLVAQPPAADAWEPSRLEYRFACAAPDGDGEQALVAEGYAGGHLDWPSVDYDPTAPDLDAADPGAPVTTHTFAGIPAPAAFDGMPNLRYWAFEDGRTNLGDVRPDTTDLAKLLFLEFGLVYANDWFVLPCEVPVGSLSRVRGLSVSNVFGESFWIERAGSRDAESWQRFALYTLEEAGLAVLPTVPKVQEADPVEQVALVRDEMANMVWGIETVVMLASGRGMRGTEAAYQTRAQYERLLGAASSTAPPPAAPIRYQVMNSVPENWIPFVPMHVPGSNREIQLQRGAMPRILEGDPNPPVRVRPRTSLLRVGLDATPPAPYYVHEEEVPRAGARVSHAYQRTRWRDGRAVVWLAAHKTVGRGEGSSGLAFDLIVESRRADAS